MRKAGGGQPVRGLCSVLGRGGFSPAFPRRRPPALPTALGVLSDRSHVTGFQVPGFLPVPLSGQHPAPSPAHRGCSIHPFSTHVHGCSRKELGAPRPDMR